ncbi:MAG: hypothetical protein WC551_00065 [Patescibacteria group bacterium]
MQQIPQMTKSEATRVVQKAFEGRRPEDEILDAALAMCGLTRPQYFSLKCEVRKVTSGVLHVLGTPCVLAPSGGRRRR